MLIVNISQPTFAKGSRVSSVALFAKVLKYLSYSVLVSHFKISRTANIICKHLKSFNKQSHKFEYVWSKKAEGFLNKFSQ